MSEISPTSIESPNFANIIKYDSARDIFGVLSDFQKSALQDVVWTHPDKKFWPKTYAALKEYLSHSPQNWLDIEIRDILVRFTQEKTSVQVHCKNALGWIFSPENMDECIAKLPDILLVASGQIGTLEKNGDAAKYFLDAGFWNLNPRKVAWCSAFVNWVLQKMGLPWTYSLSARSFLGQSGKWHVGFKDGNNILWWNQSNKVSSIPARYFPPVLGYVIPTPTGLQKFDMKGKTFADIPNGAIVVCWRSTQNKNLA